MNARSAAALAIIALLFASATQAQPTTRLPERDKPLNEKPATQFAIGAEDGEEWELLSGVRQVAFDAQDNLYVLDGNNQRVLVFNSSGRFVRQIGKRGGGPGELLAPLAMTVTTDGQVVVGDLGRRGYSVFKSDGTFIKNVPFEEGSMPGLGGGGIKAHPSGGIVARNTPAFIMRASVDGPARIPGGNGTTGERPNSFEWVHTTSGKASELFKVVLAPIEQKVTGSGQGRMSVMQRLPVFAPPVAFGVLPSGSVAVVHEAAYNIRIANNGKIERVITRGPAPRKPTEADKKKAVEQMRENMKNGANMVAIRTTNGGAPSITTGGGERDLPSVDEMLRENTFLDAVPVIRSINVDVLGRIWVARTPRDFGQVGPIDIITHDGRYIGTIPNDRAPDAVSATNRAAYIIRNDLGVEQVVVKRLPATWR